MGEAWHKPENVDNFYSPTSGKRNTGMHCSIEARSMTASDMARRHTELATAMDQSISVTSKNYWACIVKTTW